MRWLIIVALLLSGLALDISTSALVEADVTPPAIGEDATPDEVDSGRELVLNVNVTDEVAVDRVIVEYWAFRPLFFYEITSMEADGDIFTYVLEAPVRVEVLKSLPAGDDECQFLIHLPGDVVEGGD